MTNPTAILKTQKITNTFFLIILIPALIIACLSILSIYNTRLSGGVPCLFGSYSIKMQNSGFYNAMNGTYQYDSEQLFKGVALNKENYRTVLTNYNKYEDANGEKDGYIVAYYSYYDGATRAGTFDDTLIPLSVGGAEVVSAENEEKVKTEITVVMITKAAFITVNQKQYLCFAYKTDSVSEEIVSPENLILADDIFAIGVAQSGFWPSFISFASSVNGFLTLILIPCILLLVLRLVAFISYNKYMSFVPQNKHGRILIGGKGSRIVGNEPEAIIAEKPLKKRDIKYSKDKEEIQKTIMRARKALKEEDDGEFEFNARPVSFGSDEKEPDQFLKRKEPSKHSGISWFKKRKIQEKQEEKLHAPEPRPNIVIEKEKQNLLKRENVEPYSPIPSFMNNTSFSRKDIKVAKKQEENTNARPMLSRKLNGSAKDTKDKS